MKISDESTSNKIMRVCRESGCFSANYSSNASNEDSIVVLQEANTERSGSFKYSIKRQH
jgi:hypothetical protein